MQGSLDERLKMDLKRLIVEECDLMIDPGGIHDDDPLFGSAAPLGLDSIDALQISIAIQNKYDQMITDSKQMRRIMKSINTFADFMREWFTANYHILVNTSSGPYYGILEQTALIDGPTELVQGSTRMPDVRLEFTFNPLEGRDTSLAVVP